jgi:hypothetical protein
LLSGRIGAGRTVQDSGHAAHPLLHDAAMRKPFKNPKFALQRETIRNLASVTGGIPPTVTSGTATTDSLVDRCPSFYLTGCPPTTISI